MIQGKLVNNGQNNLIIVFQAAGRIPKEMFDDILNNQVDENDVIAAHQKYTWFKFSTGKHADFLFVEDYFSKSYGWYMFDEGKSIIDKFNSQIEEFIVSRGYTSVTAFGSSKGGTGSLLYGILNPKINNVFAMVPQIHAVDYIEQKLAPYKSLFFPGNDPELENYYNRIFFNEALYETENYLNTNIYLYTGVGDEQFKEALEFNQFLSKKTDKHTIIINTSLKRHNEIVMENVPFVRSALKLISNNEELKGPRLLNVRENIMLLRDK